MRLGLDSDLTTADTASLGGAVGRATGHINQKVGGSNPPRGAFFLALFDVIYIYSKLNKNQSSFLSSIQHQQKVYATDPLTVT